MRWFVVEDGKGVVSGRSSGKVWNVRCLRGLEEEADIE